MTSYIIRLDDLSRFSKAVVWEEILGCCRSNKVKCLIGIIPDCTDKKLMNGVAMDDHSFWKFVKDNSDMDMAMHGMRHEIFAGKSLPRQLKIMSESMKAFFSNGMVPDCFVAPKHAYDRNTLMAMKSLGIGYISDGIGLYPWKHMDTDIVFVPQILWRPKKLLFGVHTFCLHPDTMERGEIDNLKKFVAENRNDIISIYDVSLTPLEYINFIFEPLYIFVYKRRFGKKR